MCNVSSDLKLLCITKAYKVIMYSHDLNEFELAILKLKVIAHL